jgi:N-methylhydantoinase A
VLWRVQSKLPSAKLRAEFAALRRDALKQLRGENWSGAVSFQPSVDVRYRGQGYELNLAYTPALLRAFERAHFRTYGHSYPGRDVELVTLRLRAKIRTAAPGLGFQDHSSVTAPPTFAPVFFGEKPLRNPILSRESLRPGRRHRGPAVITEYSATTLVPPGMPFQLDSGRNLIISIPAQSRR